MALEPTRPVGTPRISVTPDRLDDLLARLGDPIIIVALDSLAAGDTTLIQRLGSSRHNIHVIPAIRGLPLFGTQLSHFFSHEVIFLTLRNNLARFSMRTAKRTFDIVGGLIFLGLLGLPMLLIGLLIRRDG